MEQEVRRSRCLVSFWESNEFLIENYLTHKQLSISPLVLHYIMPYHDFIPIRKLHEDLHPLPNHEFVIQKLIESDVLIVKGTEEEKIENQLEASWQWSHDARFFHFSTKNAVFETDPKTLEDFLIGLAKEEPPPPPYKDYSTDQEVRLNDTFADVDSAFWQVLKERRTRREFKREKISFADFSKIVQWTWGKTREFEHPKIGKYILKTSASGGSRHPIEVYPIILRVQGIDPGIYHYSVKHHKLALIRQGDFEELAAALCSYQKWVYNAAVVFIMTANLPRNMWKYRHSRAYRIVQLDAGHVGQTFHLVCTALGLAPFTTAATNDIEIEKALEIDGISEIPVYVAITGKPEHAFI